MIGEGELLVVGLLCAAGALPALLYLKRKQERELEAEVQRMKERKAEAPQLDMEERARALVLWLTNIAAAHPAAASLVIHALVDVTEGGDILGGVPVWGAARMIPPWSCATSDSSMIGSSVPVWRKRMDRFLPHRASSFLTREESSKLFHTYIGVSSPIDLGKLLVVFFIEAGIHFYQQCD